MTKQVKNIKSVLSFAFEEELHNSIKYQVVKKESEDSANIYLSESDIELLLKEKYDTHAEMKLIDAFVFICLTGVRYSDYSNLSKENFKFKDSYWYLDFQQYKTKRDVCVPIIYKKACDIINQCDFELPKYSNAYFNRELKNIFKKI